MGGVGRVSPPVYRGETSPSPLPPMIPPSWALQSYKYYNECLLSKLFIKLGLECQTGSCSCFYPWEDFLMSHYSLNFSLTPSREVSNLSLQIWDSQWLPNLFQFVFNEPIDDLIPYLALALCWHFNSQRSSNVCWCVWIYMCVWEACRERGGEGERERDAISSVCLCVWIYICVKGM